MFACNKSNDTPATSGSTIVITGDVITQSYVGNGVQWGGYDILNYWTGSPTLSEDDWNTLYQRVRFMRPPLIRVMVADGWNYLVNNEYNPSKSNDILIKILDFCEQEGISVIIGEWGHNGGSTIDQEWLEQSSNFLEWLLNTKGYTCIKYFNMVNEPNGSWSTISGNYTLWKSLVEQFHAKLVEKGIASRIKILGPDIAIWSTSSVSWINYTNADLGSIVGAYDIHTYPTESEVRNGSYQTMVKAYQVAVPASKEMIMSEFGFKYATASTLGITNALRKANDPYASDDSNMMIYDAFYGVDVADAMIQCMLAGYTGIIIWSLDDAMYNADASASTKLKRWGFWNILGAEKFENASDENIRPWFYPVSLMCRYFPAGTSIYNITLPDKKGLRAIAGVKDGEYTIAIVNSNTVSYTVDLTAVNGLVLNSMKAYSYKAGNNAEFTANLDANGFATPFEVGVTLDLSEDSAYTLSVPAQSFLLFTNMN